MRRAIAGAAIFHLGAALWPAMAGESAMPMHHSAHTATSAEKANDLAMRRMMTAMAVKPSGNADKDFARMMIAHHEGAIAMAETELTYGQDPKLKTLAGDIIEAQRKEVAVMKSWLEAHP